MVLKLSGPHLLHKSDAGAIALGIADDVELRLARDRLAALPDGERIAAAASSGWRTPGVELLISARADAVVPALTVGPGRVWTEAARMTRR